MKQLEQYLSSVLPFKAMLDEAIITDEQYNKIECFIAKKYCIKKSSLYRVNDLINPSLRAINMIQKAKEERNAKNNRNTSITKIEKSS